MIGAVAPGGCAAIAVTPALLEDVPRSGLFLPEDVQRSGLLSPALPEDVPRWGLFLLEDVQRSLLPAGGAEQGRCGAVPAPGPRPGGGRQLSAGGRRLQLENSSSGC